MEDRTTHVVIGVVTFLVAFGVLVGGAALLGSLAPLVDPIDDTEPREYDTEELYIERIEAQGQVEVARVEPQLILIDDAHRNNFEAAEINELQSALVRAGHEVRTVGTTTELEASLDDADALVVIEPERSYTNETADAVVEFVEDDGRLLMMGGPDRAELDGLFVIEQDHEINSLANRFGMSFGTDHLYDMEANDGSHRNVIVESTFVPLVADVDTVVVSTATHVTTAEGRTLLVTNETAQRADGGQPDEYTVAAMDDNVMAVGDTEFLVGERYNVADNEKFIAAMVDFLGG